MPHVIRPGTKLYHPSAEQRSMDLACTPQLLHHPDHVNEAHFRLMHSNWMHCMFGYFVPLLAALDSACSNCKCLDVALILPEQPPSGMLIKQLTALPIRINTVIERDASARTVLWTHGAHELLRCDGPFSSKDGPGTHCSRERTKALINTSCLKQCTLERSWLKARRALASLWRKHRVGVDFTRRRPSLPLLFSLAANRSGTARLHVLLIRRPCDACSLLHVPPRSNASSEALPSYCRRVAPHHLMCQPGHEIHQSNSRPFDNDSAFSSVLAQYHRKEAMLRRALGVWPQATVTVNALDLSPLPFIEQIKHVANANAVLLQHGAALSTAVWSRPSTRWVEMSPYLVGSTLDQMTSRQQLLTGRAHLQHVVRALAPSLQLEYVAVAAAPRGWSAPQPAGRSPWNSSAVAAKLCWVWSCLDAQELTAMLLAVTLAPGKDWS